MLSSYFFCCFALSGFIGISLSFSLGFVLTTGAPVVTVASSALYSFFGTDGGISGGIFGSRAYHHSILYASSGGVFHGLRIPRVVPRAPVAPTPAPMISVSGVTFHSL